MQTVLFEWKGQEYAHNPKSDDWYWALGIIAVAAFIAAVLFKQYLVAVLIVVATAAIALHAAKHPSVHTFRLTDQGLMIGDDLHPYGRMISFSVLEDIEGQLPPLLSIHTESWLYPHLNIPLEHDHAEHIYAMFLDRVEEADHQHTLSDVVSKWLGFR